MSSRNTRPPPTLLSWSYLVTPFVIVPVNKINTQSREIYKRDTNATTVQHDFVEVFLLWLNMLT